MQMQILQEAINLFAVTQILSKNHSEALGEFVDYYLSNAMDNNKINALYEKFDEIHKVGLFFPVFINEMNFLGEKVFGRAVKKDKIYAEVNELANFLFRYANRKINEETISMEYTGTHCKFAIRLIGKSWKIDQEGEHIYINNIQKVYSSVETIYLLGNATHQGFIENVVKILLPNINYRVYNKKTFEAQIKDCSGNDFSVSNFLVILRNNIVTTFHKK